MKTVSPEAHALPFTEPLAARKVKFWSYENRLVGLLTLGGGVSALDSNALFYIMPFVSVDLHLNNTDIGELTFALMVSWALSGLIAGLFSDRLGSRKPFLVAAFLLFSVFSLFSGLARSFTMLFAARLLVGLAEGPVIPIQQAIVMRESRPHRRGANMGIVQNFGSSLIGNFGSSLLLVYIATLAGWRSAFFVAAGPGLAMALLIFFFVREPKITRSKAAPTASFKEALSVLKNRNIQLCAVLSTTWSGFFFLLMTFLPIWFVSKLGLSSGTMSILMGMAGAAGVVSSILVPSLSDRFGRRPIIVLFILVAAIIPISVLYAGSNPALLFLTTFLGFTTLGTTPLFVATVPIESVSERHAATASAIISATGQFGGGLIGPVLGGVLADRFGLTVILWVVLALVLISAAIAAALRETAPRFNLRAL